MNNIKVTLINTITDKDLSLISDAARLTQVVDFSLTGQYIPKLVKKLKDTNHTSLFEFVDTVFFIEGVSRVFLSQITRHRHCSFVSSSQQYQHQEKPSFIIPTGLHPEDQDEYLCQMEAAWSVYNYLEKQVGRDQARYVLPGAAKVNMLIKCNLRELLFNIIPLRTCRRNTEETKHVLKLICNLIPYDLLTGPACLTTGKCDQPTNMACNNQYQSIGDLL